MSERISGSAVMVAFAEAVDDGVSNYKLAIFYLGVSAGQSFSRGWSQDDLDKELSNLEASHPKLAGKIRQELLGAVGEQKASPNGN